MKKPLPPKEALQPLIELTGIPWAVWKDLGLPQKYQEYIKSQAKFNPFTNDPNCKTCGKK
jgi:hypothetical protein